MQVSSDRGSAPAEFILLGVPMILIALVFGQVMVLAHQREILQDVAIETASYAALGDQSLAAAESRAEELLGKVEISTEFTNGFPKTLQVRLKKPGWIALEAVGYAVFEIQR